MANEPSSSLLLQLPFSFSFSFFSLLLLSSLPILYFFIKHSYCNCTVCHTFLTSTWTEKFENLADWYTELLKNSPTQTIHNHVLNNTITANPQNLEHILKTRFENYPKGKPFSAILGDLLGRGIFNVDGSLWKFQRKIVSLELGTVSARSHAFQIVSNEITQRLIPVLTNSGPGLDLQDVFRRFSFDNICKISFGLDPGCLELSLPISEFASAFDLASELSARRAIGATPMTWKLKRFFNIGSERKLKQSIKMVDQLAEEMIKQRRKEGFESHQDLLSRFMATVNDDKLLRDIVISFLLAGRDTVASALTSFFWLLSNHPNVESSLYDEIVGNTKNCQFASYEQLKNMHYLHAAISESMRLYPPVQFDSKFALHDDVLPDGTCVKKGTRVTYHAYAMGRMEKIWGKDCMEFKPERWLENGIFRQQNPFKYPVFQAGFRVCLGKELAFVEMKSVVAALVSRFRFVADPDYKPRFVPGLTANLRGGLLVRVVERTGLGFQIMNL